MDICENCHEKDRNVLKCDRKMEDHLNLSDFNDYYVGQVIDVCFICGKITTDLYVCDKYDIMKRMEA